MNGRLAGQPGLVTGQLLMTVLKMDRETSINCAQLQLLLAKQYKIKCEKNALQRM